MQNLKYESGRAKLKYVSGKKSQPCSNCGKKTATMYKLSLSKETGYKTNISWKLCVTCRSHLENVFRKHDKDFDDLYL